ncbi:2-oxo-4-hydroxy-4-carboxy-5-ureidoimidazoline decarboxylase [Niveispirillum sp. SYP-B3756]|uniref:2-oxo-4-hydroxy-4-carboxy-5-ureidoimidazoline decarboxylase n=1 Tax=Niveispirillum sp. SYP-B3756 TaxID=2662178 RepID=UPI0012916BA8|nr:2-oxo-4-hydroxy-4-carboxy-5-ureidoimidazoline decarboxylase [Niveispirillum sp. SYP-B3756]MQP64562.1 2-oxo-4-hydroxy-4-carboxy-5-ureidoimidazoline decarboxylase [Niveispirillum sp. SYP-B3756]
MIDALPAPVLDRLNAADCAGFTHALGAVFEDSPWVATAAWAARPFPDIAALHQAMVAVVDAAGKERQLALLRAHPDLAGRLARAGGLTAHSSAEQAGLGLDRLSAEEFDFFDRHNRSYREKFGFPFIIAVKAQTKASIKAAMVKRLANDAGTERRTALGEVAMIAKFRLEAMTDP